jgi:hypothetical protein
LEEWQRWDSSQDWAGKARCGWEGKGLNAGQQKVNLESGEVRMKSISVITVLFWGRGTRSQVGMRMGGTIPQLPQTTKETPISAPIQKEIKLSKPLLGFNT